MKFVKVNSNLLRRILHDSRFRRWIAQPVRLNFNFDVPYLAGYSVDGRTVYIDRHLKYRWKYKGRVIDVTDFLVVHEVVEKALMCLFRLHYQKAHHIATHVENMACKQHGVDWLPYSDYLRPQIKTADHEQIKRIPLDLDIEPYEDEHEQRILAQMQLDLNKERQDESIFCLT
jgi:hypothetical protein